MRSVCALTLARSNSATSQCLTISSQACCGMMPSRAWARARAASKSRYFWIRFSSENTRRIASVEKISRNTAESTAVAGIRKPFGKAEGAEAGGLATDWRVNTASGAQMRPRRAAARMGSRRRSSAQCWPGFDNPVESSPVRELSAEPAEHEDRGEQAGQRDDPADHECEKDTARHVDARGATRGSRPAELLRSRRAADAPERDNAAVVVARARIAERVCLADEMQRHGSILF